MSDPRYSVAQAEIERLVLTGLDLTLGQAERLREQVADELQRTLARRAWSDQTSADVSRLSLPPLDLDIASGPGAVDDGQLASKLARCIAQALPGGDGKGDR
jgi:hypothetical protein